MRPPVVPPITMEKLIEKINHWKILSNKPRWSSDVSKPGNKR
jgi:hypothetical protein